MVKVAKVAKSTAGAAKVQIDLPEGVLIEQRPGNIDLLTRTKNKWVGIAQRLETIKGTEMVTIPLGNLLDTPGVNGKQKIQSIKAGIKSAAKSMGFDASKIKFAVNNAGDKLYCWAN